MSRDRLVSAMLTTPDLQAAYHFSPEFRVQVTVIADMLPIILKGLHDSAVDMHRSRRLAYERLLTVPQESLAIEVEP